MSDPVVPAKKKHRLHIEKASNQLKENFSSCQDNGKTSHAYKFNPTDDKTNLFKNRLSVEFSNRDLSQISQEIQLKSIDDWRVNSYPYTNQSLDFVPTYLKIQEKSLLRTDTRVKKKTDIKWEDYYLIDEITDEKDPINFIITQRKKFGWNTFLPVYGSGAMQAMREYQDRIDDEFHKSVDDDGKFLYCLSRSNIKDNILYSPYDLVVVNAKKAKSSEIYFTVSATNVIRIDNVKKENEILTSMKWLWEKKLFDMLRKIKAFSLFRKWRTFKCWRINIRESKQHRSSDLLRRKLFSANEIFQSVLLHVRKLCERASSSRDGIGEGNDAITMISYDSEQTLTLSDFESMQYLQIEIALDKLRCLKEEIMDLTYISCITVGELEGIDFEAFFDSDNFKHEKTFFENYINQRKNKTSRLRDLHLILPPQNEKGPSFTQRKEWRYVLSRICHFLRLVDYLIQELVQRVVKTSTKHLRDFVINSTNKGLDISEKSSIGSDERRPSFGIKITDESNNKLNENEKNLEQFQTMSVLDRLHEELKKESMVIKPIEAMFVTNLVLNVEREQIYKESLENYNDIEENESEKDTVSRKSFNSSTTDSETRERLRVFATISPNQSTFKNFFKDLIYKYEETAGKIQTLLHEPRFKIFYEIPVYELSRYEKQLRESITQEGVIINENVRPWPEVQYLFGEDEDYQDVISQIMTHLTTSLNNISTYIQNYTKYCQMVEAAIRLNIEEYVQEKALKPDDFQFLLAKHTEQLNEIKLMGTEKRVCIFDFRANKFQNDCMPYPSHVINTIDKFLPQMAIKRNEKLQETMRDALKMLDKDPTSVEDFVEHLAILSHINNEMPNLENEFVVVTRLFSISNDFGLKIDPEQYAFFKSLGSTFHHLKSSLLYTEAQCEENIRKFTIDLNTLINKVHKDSIELKVRLQSPALLSSDTNIQIANENLTLFQEMIEKLVEKAKNYASFQERFGNTLKQVKKKPTQSELLNQDYNRSGISILTVQSELNELEHDIGLRRLLWKSIEEWDQLVKEWLNKQLDDIKVDLIQKDVNRFTQNIYLLEKGLSHNELVPKLKEKVLDFKKALPIIISLRNPNLKGRHYILLKALIGHDLANEKQKITMSVLLDADVLHHRDKISEISALATNEATLETMLNKIIDIWKKTDFRLIVDNARDTFIITGTDEIQILLEESHTTMATIKSSRYVGPIKNQVEDWDRRLTLFSKTLDEWIVCQKRWLYLKQIFSTADIQRQLTQETKVFNQIEKFWKDLMRKTDDKPNALRAATTPGLFESLQSYATQMEKIQRSLEDYFETKRLIFPRLYFLSNEDLLDILSQAKDQQKIQPHLNKCFGNVNGLDIYEKNNEITHLISFEAEKLELIKSVRIRGPAEQWLGAIETGMYETIKRNLKFGLADYQKMEYGKWVLKQIGQIVLLVNQIMFNKRIVGCLNSERPTEALKEYCNDLVESINIAASLISKSLPSHKVLTIEALLTIEVHSRDILDGLIEQKIQSSDDFEWRRHLRYEWEDQNNQCIVQQSDSFFNYGYEYLGCSPRLVITPLTDRCYLTLTGALKLNLGGAPAGPAGTGKTETVKDLAKSIGKLCLVFNCSEGLDYKMLGKFFCGLAQSGSWCCFDEFNRIDIEVLSVVAQQMLTIKTAKDSLAVRFLFEGRDIKLNSTCGFFITMNPTYAGRVELPDNLKPLFRPVAMMVPDYALIAEIILFSVGFTSAKALATKIVTLYYLANRQLSQQDHYDFGMRTIKAVLLMAGQAKKNFLEENQQASSVISEEQESQILMQALYDTNLPKFLKDDVILFQNLMNDLFPSVKKMNKNQEFIEKSINMATRELNYQPWHLQSEKIMQLYDQMLVRHGIMLVGPTGGGKTVSRNILQKALGILPTVIAEKNDKQKGILSMKVKSRLNAIVKFNLLKKSANDKKQTISEYEKMILEKRKKYWEQHKHKKAKIESLTINPKSISINELYGSIDPTTLEWSDGVFGNVIRNFANSSTQIDIENDNLPAWQFVILDGPVDTFWVENLNSVLDDSKILCLSNGERISLTPNIRVIFEVDSLIHTSPATVSRCAMVYFEPSDLGLAPIIKNWMNTLPKDFPKSGIELLNQLLDFSLQNGFEFFETRKNSTSFPFNKLNALNCLFALISSFIDFFGKNGGFGEKESSQAELKPAINKHEKSKTEIEPTIASNADSTQKQYYLQKNPKQLQALIIKIYIFSYIWSFGGLLKREDNTEDDNIINQKSHVKSNFDSLTREFDETVRELFECNVKYGIYLPPPAKPVFDYFLDVTTGNFIEWSHLLPNSEALIRQNKFDRIIDTVDSVRFTFLTSLLLMSKRSVLITGSSGIGKTVIIQDMLKRLVQNGFSYKQNSILGDVFNYLEKTKAQVLTHTSSMYVEEPEILKKTKSDELGIISNSIQFSAQTSSNKFINLLLSKLSKKGPNMLGAPKHKHVIAFIDDLNIPIADKFGDQPPLEQLRFLIEYAAFHDIKNSCLKTVSDLTFVLCCTPPSSGRNPLSPRLLRQCCILSMPEPSAKSLFNIYEIQLGRFFLEHDFNVDIKSCLLSLVSSCLVMYYRVFINFLPTPKKSHYIFNFRDLSKLVKGLMQANSLVVVTKENLVDLFAHECIRVFNDRLITKEDNESFFNHLCETISDYFKISFANPVRPSPKISLSHDITEKFSTNSDQFPLNTLIYGDFIKTDDRIYQPLNNWKQIVSILGEFQMRSNMAGHATRQIVFFKEAVEHIVRACRVLRQSGGHMLLIGLDGTGKNTIMELASFISNCSMFKLNLKKGYCYTDFRDDLKAVFKMTGIQKKKIVLFISDKDISEELFLEDLDSLLTSGNIPDLFDVDEFDSLLMDLKNDAVLEGVTDEKNELKKYLIGRVQANLHLVLSMSPVGVKFRERCRFHPAIINCTTIDWYNDWSETAMKQVSVSFMENIDLDITYRVEQEDDLKEKIAKSCVYIHMSLIKESENFFNQHKRRYYVTPSCFIDLLRTFSKIFDAKRAEYLESLSRLKNGLEKLSEANELVALMKEELTVLGPKLETKAKETDELMGKLVKDQEAMNQVKAIVEQEEEKMRSETEMVQQYAQEAEKDLADVIPILAAARESLNALNKLDISEIRVYNNPPFLVMTVMSAVCIILQKKPDWGSAKQILADPTFITKLINFNPETITEKTYVKFKQFSKNPDFTPHIVGKVSKACESLCAWVIAVEKFHEVYKTVRPKEEKVKEANEALEIMRNGLQKKQFMLEQLQKHIDQFKSKYDESLNEKQALENKKELIKLRIVRAAELTAALDTEKVRWSNQYENLKNEAAYIIGHSLISAGAVNYLGPLTQDFRSKIQEKWIKFCKIKADLSVNESFELNKNVVEQHVIRTWINQNLPDDHYSIENAIFLKYSLKWPLIIDPQNQVIRWIKEMEGKTLKICKSDDPLIFRTLEQAIRLGQPVLIEGIGEDLDPLLDPVLQKQIVIRGAQKLLKLGDVEIEYNDSFRLYLVTSLSNPHYLPSTFIKVNLINFTITFKCLFEQFLSLVVLKERPELEKERTNLLESIAKDFSTLRELEDRSLTILSNAETSKDSENRSLTDKNLLDDQNLIDTLKQSKKTSADISMRLNKNEETERNLNLARQKYSEIAVRACIIYFTIQNLSLLNVMYQFSLNWFYNIFQSCLGDSNPGKGFNEKKELTLTESTVSGLLASPRLNAGKIRPKINLQSSHSSFSSKPNDSRVVFQSEEEFNKHISAIIDLLTHTVYEVVSWGLFAEHQLMFTFSLTLNILKHNENKSVDKISEKEYTFFLNSNLLADLQQDSLIKRIEIIQDVNGFLKQLVIEEKALRQIILLQDIIPEKFATLCDSLEKRFDSCWKELVECTDPYKLMSQIEKSADFNFENLTKFQKLILIKLLRPDALILAINHFIHETLGSRFLGSGVPTLNELFAQSQCGTPIIFILSPGSDPTNQLLRFAKELRGSTLHLDIVSLGQGQGPRAEELISKSLLLKGRWIFLQNCHLAASFMPRLEAIVNNFNRSGFEIDKQFRLFLSSKPDQSFPISLLKAGIKMTIESPKGLKNNLIQNFGPGGFINKTLYESSEYGPHWKRLLFSLGFIHSLIHERKKFGPLGWNLPYEFNNSDFEVSILQLQSVLQLNPLNIPFNVLKYITGEVIYGGRVTDNFDRRCLLSILGKFFCSQAVQDTHYYDNKNMYKAPEKNIAYSALIEYIEKIPDEDDPSIFGMNDYAEKLLRANQSDNLIMSILSMEPIQTLHTRIGHVNDENEIVNKICFEITTLLPEKVLPTFERGKHLSFEEAISKLPEKLATSYYEYSAMLTVLRQEITRYNKLLSVIFKSIGELTKAIKGEIMISKSSENTYNSIVLQKVPKEWERYSYPSQKPLSSWVKNLFKRIQFFAAWSKTIIMFVENTASTIYPSSFWISGFFFPQGLLAAISQNYARKYNVSIDSLLFVFDVQNELYDETDVEIASLFEGNNEKFKLKENPDAILIHGFFMDGARWDRQTKKICDSNQRFNPMPHFSCQLTMKSETSPSEESKTKYKCPVYRNSVRAGSSNDQAKNFVTSVDIECQEDMEFWILRGVCMILQSDD